MAHHQLSAFASAIAELFARIPSSETADHHEQAYAQVYSEVGRLTQLLPSEQWPDALRVVHTSLGNQTSQIAHRSPPCLHTWSAMLANCSSGPSHFTLNCILPNFADLVILHSWCSWV
jgi:hypothetical protein